MRYGTTNFRRQGQTIHNKVVIGFETLDLNMTLVLPLNYMHLVCLGLVGKLLNLRANSSREWRIIKPILESLTRLAKSDPSSSVFAPSHNVLGVMLTRAHYRAAAAREFRTIWVSRRTFTKSDTNVFRAGYTHTY